MKKQKKIKKNDKSLISTAQKADNYSEDSSIQDVLKRKGDIISNTSIEKDDIQKLHKKGNKSLISGSSKENKDDNDIDDEKEFSVANISKIDHFIGDESKNGEDIINEMNDKDDKKNKKENNNNNEDDNNLDMNLNINDIQNNKEDNKEDGKEKENKKEADIIKVNDIDDDISLDTPKEEDKKE